MTCLGTGKNYEEFFVIGGDREYDYAGEPNGPFIEKRIFSFKNDKWKLAGNTLGVKIEASIL